MDEIIVATRQDLLLTVADLCSRCGLHKPVKVVLGGPTRAQSVLAAAVEANPKAGLLAVHDAARPLVDPAEFDEIIRFACRTNAAAPAVPGDGPPSKPQTPPTAASCPRRTAPPSSRCRLPRSWRPAF